jgi:hypothetical protein
MEKRQFAKELILFTCIKQREFWQMSIPCLKSKENEAT